LFVSAEPFHSSRLMDAEIFDRRRAEPALGLDRASVDFQDGTFRVVKQRLDRRVQRAELAEQFAHVCRTTARGSLIGHGVHPLHPPGLEQRPHAHQHAADGAISPDPVAPALGQRVADHRHVHRVEDDDGVGLHAQRRSGVDPVALPARRAQPGKYIRRVVAALRGDDDVAAFQRLDVVGVKQLALVFREQRRRAACIAGAEEHRFDVAEVAFRLHAFDEHGTDHSAPSHQARQFHVDCPFGVISNPCSPGSHRREEGAKRNRAD
jgi:hypothetical protein